MRFNKKVVAVLVAVASLSYFVYFLGVPRTIDDDGNRSVNFFHKKLIHSDFPYYKDADNVYYRWSSPLGGKGVNYTVLEDADTETFVPMGLEAISRLSVDNPVKLRTILYNLPHSYGVDKQSVYIKANKVEDADPGSFAHVDDYYFVDEDRAYYYYSRKDDLSDAAWEYLGGCEDDASYLQNNGCIKELEGYVKTDQFKVMNGFSHDGNNRWEKSFKSPLSIHEAYEDVLSNEVKEVPGTESFIIFRNGAYYLTPIGIAPNYSALLSFEWNKHHARYIFGSDAATFDWLGGLYSKDKNYVYFMDMRIHDANPDYFYTLEQTGHTCGTDSSIINCEGKNKTKLEALKWLDSTEIDRILDKN